MAHKTLIDGTAYEIKEGKALVDGTTYKLEKGNALVEGTSYDIEFIKQKVTNIWGSGSEIRCIQYGAPSDSSVGYWLVGGRSYRSDINNYQACIAYSYNLIDWTTVYLFSPDLVDGIYRSKSYVSCACYHNGLWVVGGHCSTDTSHQDACIAWAPMAPSMEWTEIPGWRSRSAMNSTVEGVTCIAGIGDRWLIGGQYSSSPSGTPTIELRYNPRGVSISEIESQSDWNGFGPDEYGCPYCIVVDGSVITIGCETYNGKVYEATIFYNLNQWFTDSWYRYDLWSSDTEVSGCSICSIAYEGDLYLFGGLYRGKDKISARIAYTEVHPLKKSSGDIHPGFTVVDLWEGTAASSGISGIAKGENYWVAVGRDSSDIAIARTTHPSSTWEVKTLRGVTQPTYTGDPQILYTQNNWIINSTDSIVYAPSLEEFSTV